MKINCIIKSFLFSACLCVVSQSSFASGMGWLFKEGGDANSEFHQRMPDTFLDDITSDQNSNITELTLAQKHQALVWGLSDDEEKRYLFLIQNQSGFFYDLKKVSPVEILGMNARTDNERKKYAEMDAKNQFQYMAKYLSYVSDYNQAALSLKDKLKLPVINQFDYKPFSPYNYKPISLESNDKLMLFLKLNSAVKPIIASLLNSMTKNNKISLNVYFIGKNISKTAIETWAQDQNIPPAMVEHNQITLNFGNSEFESLKTTKSLPVLVLIRDRTSRFVDTSRF